MKRVVFLTPLVLAAVAGCAPAPNQIQAGQWEIITEVRALDAPGATPEQLRTLQRSAGQVGMTDTETRCLSDAEARSFVQDIRSAPPQCQVTDEVYANGVMRTHVSCPAQPGQPQGIKVSLEGQFTASTLNATVEVEGPNPVGATQGPMRRTVRLRGRRLGVCQPSATPPGLPMAPPPQSAPAPAPTPPASNTAG